MNSGIVRRVTQEGELVRLTVSGTRDESQKKCDVMIKSNNETIYFFNAIGRVRTSVSWQNGKLLAKFKGFGEYEFEKVKIKNHFNIYFNGN